MAQLRAKTCPLCGGPNDGKWTCPSCTKVVNTYRALIRNLQQWRVLFESREVSDVIVGPDGADYCLWDIESLYQQRTLLPIQQQRAIQLCWFDNVLERKAAERMGVSSSSPVAVYATVGLTRLLSMALHGDLPGLRIELSAEEPPS